MYTRIAYSDREKRTFLEKLIAAAEKDAAAGRVLVAGNLVNQARNLLADYGQRTEDLQDGYAERMRLVAARNVTRKKLTTTIRHFWANVRFRALREDSDNWSVQKYKLHVNQPAPKITRHDQWIAAAKELIAGEAKVVAAGAEPMANPSAAQLTNLLTEIQALDDELLAHQAILADLRTQINTERNRVLALYAKIARYMRYSLDYLSAAQRREEMRRYGFLFQTNGTLDSSPAANDGEVGGGADGQNGNQQETGSDTGTGDETDTGSNSETDAETQGAAQTADAAT